MVNITLPGSSSPNRRPSRVGSLIQKALSEIFIHGSFSSFYKVSAPITLTQVKMSNDLQVAFVYIMPLGGIDTEKNLEIVQEAIPFLRKELAHMARLRVVPNLVIRLDTSFDYAQKINILLEQHKKDFSSDNETID